MTQAQILQGVESVIAQNSRYAANEISATDPIDKFISSFMADRLAGALAYEFNLTGDQTTDLTNQLYTSLKKVQDIVNYISAIKNK